MVWSLDFALLAAVALRLLTNSLPQPRAKFEEDGPKRKGGGGKKKRAKRGRVWLLSCGIQPPRTDDVNSADNIGTAVVGGLLACGIQPGLDTCDAEPASFQKQRH